MIDISLIHHFPPVLTSNYHMMERLLLTQKVRPQNFIAHTPSNSPRQYITTYIILGTLQQSSIILLMRMLILIRCKILLPGTYIKFHWILSLPLTQPHLIQFNLPIFSLSTHGYITFPKPPSTFLPKWNSLNKDILFKTPIIPGVLIQGNKYKPPIVSISLILWNRPRYLSIIKTFQGMENL